MNICSQKLALLRVCRYCDPSTEVRAARGPTSGRSAQKPPQPGAATPGSTRAGPLTSRRCRRPGWPLPRPLLRGEGGTPRPSPQPEPPTKAPCCRVCRCNWGPPRGLGEPPRWRGARLAVQLLDRLHGLLRQRLIAGESAQELGRKNQTS